MKKLLSAILAVTMVMGLSLTSFAASPVRVNTTYGSLYGSSGFSTSGNTVYYSTFTEIERKPVNLRATYYVQNYNTGAWVVTQRTKTGGATLRVTTDNSAGSKTVKLTGACAHEAIGVNNAWVGRTSGTSK